MHNSPASVDNPDAQPLGGPAHNAMGPQFVSEVSDATPPRHDAALVSRDTPPDAHSASSVHAAATPTLMLTALGVVYGDIGTSPLYALKESFNPAHGVVLSDDSIMGILSMLAWAVTFVVTLKYVSLILRANHQGEGGILALQALARLSLKGTSGAANYRTRMALTAIGAIGLLGAAMFYGDALITPAISVLSAIEGLELVTPALKPYVLPITAGILIALFAVQRFGTATVGRAFGPIVLLWFMTLAVLGTAQIIKQPQILGALNPLHAIGFFVAHPGMSFVILGSVFLAVTGAEALYADMGHFGASAVQRAWLWVAMPALMLNYFGQGALLMSDPTALENPFYRLVPDWGVIPLVVLAAAATVIASQATITGAYSLTVQAIALDYLPRMKVVQTANEAKGQIYVPLVNWLMLLGVLALVFGFGSSSGLSAAYGISITITMVCTSLLFAAVAHRVWGWKLRVLLPLMLFILFVDSVFLLSNLAKVMHGGWMPIALAAILIALMGTWSKALRLRNERAEREGVDLASFVTQLTQNPPHRALGTAVYLSANNRYVPHALLHNLKHNQVLHERLILLSLCTTDLPRVGSSDKLLVKQLAPHVWQVSAKLGFMESINVRELMQLLSYQHGIDTTDASTTYFLSRSSTTQPNDQRMWPVQRQAFAFMQRNASRAADHYQLPNNRTVEFGRSV